MSKHAGVLSWRQACDEHVAGGIGDYGHDYSDEFDDCCDDGFTGSSSNYLREVGDQDRYVKLRDMVPVRACCQWKMIIEDCHEKLYLYSK